MATREDNNLNALFGPTPDCRAIEDLVPLLEGRRGPDEQRRMKSHVACCAHCRTELALLQEFESPAARPDERADVEWIAARLRRTSSYAGTSDVGQTWWRRIWKLPVLVPASVVLAAALVAIFIAVQPNGSGPSFPSGGREVMRSQSVDLIAPLGDLTQAPAALHWSAVPGAIRYRVRLMEVDRTELWSTTVPQTSVDLPTAIRRQVVPLKTLLWEITALDGSGIVIARSGAASFRLAPNTP